MGGWGSGNRLSASFTNCAHLLEGMNRFLRQDEEAPKNPQNSSHSEALKVAKYVSKLSKSGFDTRLGLCGIGAGLPATALTQLSSGRSKQKGMSSADCNDLPGIIDAGCLL
jgi:hypothetical protein